MNSENQILCDRALARITRIRELTDWLCGPKPPRIVPRYVEPKPKSVRPTSKTTTKGTP